MARCLSLSLTLLAVLSSCLLADHVVVTGGPALRKWEDLRVKEDRHDRWWANFIRASTIRIDGIIKEPGHDKGIVWMVFRPGYQGRAAEDGKPYPEWIEGLAQKRGVRLVWFSSADDFIRSFNQLPKRSVTSFDYFGHSNKFTFMFDYGSDIMAASTAWLHENDLSRLKGSVFHPEALCTSWGCHTGESMSLVWEDVLKVPLRGVKGPTNYTSVGRGELPEARGPWSR